MVLLSSIVKVIGIPDADGLIPPNNNFSMCTFSMINIKRLNVNMNVNMNIYNINIKYSIYSNIHIEHHHTTIHIYMQIENDDHDVR